MKHSALPIAAVLVLSACARVEPIDLNEVEEVEPLAIENVVDDGPVLDANLSWQVEGLTASFGSADAPLLTLACTDGSLEISRFADGTIGAGTLTFGTSGALASVAVAADGDTQEAESYTASLAPGDIGDDLVAVFASGTPIDVTMTGVDALIVAADPQVAGLVSACIEREAEDASDDTDADAAASNQIS